MDYKKMMSGLGGPPQQQPSRPASDQSSTSHSRAAGAANASHGRPAANTSAPQQQQQQQQQPPAPGGPLGAAAGAFGPQGIQSLMSWIPWLLSLAQRVPAWVIGFAIGLLWWVVLVPLVASTLLAAAAGDGSGDEGAAGAGGAGVLGRMLPALFGGDAAAAAATEVEWDALEQEATLAKHQSRKHRSAPSTRVAARIAAGDPSAATTGDEDGDDANEDEEWQQRQQRFTDALDSLSALQALSRCVARGQTTMRCMHGAHSLLGTFVFALVLLGFVASGATEWWRLRQDSQRQHQRAMDIVEDVFQMKRTASLD